MIHRLLSTSIVVAPSGAPQRVYGLRVLEFETSDSPCHGASATVDTARLYELLRAGEEIVVTGPVLKPFESEQPGLLLAERLLTLRMDSEGSCRLTMP